MLRDATETSICQDLRLEVTSSMTGVEYEAWSLICCTTPKHGVYEVDPRSFTEVTPPVETRPAIGDHGAWQEWYIDHSNCGGTWVYVKEPGNDRVICSCSMGMGGSA